MSKKTSRTLGGLLFVLAICPALAADQPVLYSIEEDWEMVIREPDPATHSPQVTFFTCPISENEQQYFQLQMNYHAAKEFSGGGFHVGAFIDDSQKDEARSEMRIPLRNDGDRISWTNVMALIGQQYFFAVNNGHGDDWGSFGGPEYLVSMGAGEATDLSHYSPAKSKELVDIGFGANRVESIRLKKVRYYYSNGTMSVTSFDSEDAQSSAPSGE